LAVLNIKDLWYQYPLANSPVLKGVNLTVNKGEFVTILGPSGCGKSTLGLTVNGIIPNQLGGKISGSVEVSGMNTMEHDVGELARNVGIVFQNPDAQIIHLYVEDEVAFPMQNLLVEPDVMRERINETLKMVGMLESKKTLTNTLSGGQKQRLSIATALAMNPEILILDEPTVHLDPQGAAEVVETIKQLNRDREIAILLIEHKLDDVIMFSDRIVVMNEGSIVADGNPRELLLDKASYIMNDLGLFIPQVTEVASYASERGHNFATAPLSVEDFPMDIKLQVNPAKTSHADANNEIDTMHENVVELDHVSFQYPTGKLALDNVSLNILKGEIVALLGSNGSGKTTLAKTLIGLLKPTQGEVRIKNGNTTLNVSKTSPKVLSRFIGFSFQNPENQFITENVYDEVAFGLRLLENVTPEEVKERTMTMLDKFGLKEFVNEHPLNLSMGQKRRLSVATMLILEPRMIIFDEPMTGQDKRRTDFMVQMIANLRNQGTTAIIITHDMRFVADLATRVIVLNQGRLSFQDTPEKLFNNPEILQQNSLTDPAVHRLALKYSKNYGDQINSVITVQQFCDRMELKQ